MRKISIFLLFIIVLSLAACGGGDEVIPTAAPAADTLRTAPTATPKLPPTWTPEILIEGQHLPGGSAPSAGSGGGSQPAGPAVDLSQYETYTVQPGDSLGKIAEKFGVTVSAIAELNRIVNIDRIEVGTVLAIPE